MYFRKYQLRRTWLDKRLKSRVSEDSLTDNIANGSKHCCNFNDTTFTIFINHCVGSCIGKTSLLVIYKILRLFLNTLIPDDKHYLLNRDNLTQPIKMQLSQKIKTFYQLFLAFLKSILNFKHLPKKDHPHS